MHSTLLGQHLLQFRQGQIGTRIECLQQTALGRLVDAAHRPMPLLDAFGSPAAAILPRDLLGPTQADAEPLRKFGQRPLAAAMSGQQLTTQIVFVGLRHTSRGSHQSYLIVTSKML